jgi:hypothetical protein
LTRGGSDFTDGAANRADVHAGRTHQTVKLAELGRELQQLAARLLAVAADVHQPPAGLLRGFLEIRERHLGGLRAALEIREVRNEFAGDRHGLSLVRLGQHLAQELIVELV